jgi:hypothetical protein
MSLGCGTETSAQPAGGGLDAASSQGDATGQPQDGGATLQQQANAGDADLPDAPGDAYAAQGSANDGAGSLYGSSACAQCIASSCTSETAACTGDPDCSTYLACLDACPVGPTGAVSQTCAQACPKGSTTSGATAEQPLETCMTTAAGSQCGACGADAGSGNSIPPEQCTPPTSYANACDLCTKTHCCVSDANCAANPDCGSYLDCILGCTTAPSTDAGNGAPDGGADGGATLTGPGACEEACAQQFPSGRPDWAAVTACTTIYCAGPNDCDAMPAPCLQCITSQCASEYVAYEGSSEGFALSFCISGCAQSDIDCETTCYEQFPDALASVTDVNQCALGQCPACQGP